MQSTTPESFDADLAAAPVALVKFYGHQCPPCRMIAPMVDKVAEQFADKVTFLACESQMDPELAMRFEVSSIPTLVLFKNGQPVNRLNGMVNAPDLIAALNAVLDG